MTFGALYPDRVPCRVCGHTAYDLSEIAPHPCSHDLPLCEDCRLLEPADGGCLDCRLDVERDLYAGDKYDPRADPFYRPQAAANDAAYWDRPPLTLPGSPGFKPKDQSA